MAKPIPVKKKKPVAKKKATAEKVKFPKAAVKAFEAMEARMKERYTWALALKEMQDEELQVAVNRMVMVMARMAGEPVFVHEKQNYTFNNIDRLRTVQYHSHLWIAMRMLVAAAEWDIRIGNFKAPKRSCVRCGKKVKSGT